MARLRSTARAPRRHRGQRAIGTLIVRHAGSGSPQLSQNGGVNGMIEFQQLAQIGPRVGRSSGAAQAPQTGANTTASSASTRVGRSARVELDALGVPPEPLQPIEQAGLTRKDVDDEIEVVDQ